MENTRRRTLAGNSNNQYSHQHQQQQQQQQQQHNVSSSGTSIPIPSSVRRSGRPSEIARPNYSGMGVGAGTSSGGGRHSLAPSRSHAGRQSYVPQNTSNNYSAAHVAPATVSRSNYTYGGGGGGHNTSVYGSSAMTMGGGMTSVSKGESAYYKSSNMNSNNYAPPSVRRSSIGRRSSIHNNATANSSGAGALHPSFLSSGAPVKDPRNHQEWSRTFKKEIYEFLSERGYPDSLTPKTVDQPTGKDFQSIFRFIYSCWDPSHTKWSKKIEDDVPQLLRIAGYPYVSSITKSQLQTVGTKIAWQNLLAMLHWFVTSIKASENSLYEYTEVQVDVEAPKSEQALDRPQAPIEFWAEFLNSAYPVFLAAMDDNFDVSHLISRLEQRFEKYLEASKANIVKWSEETEQLNQELETLGKQPSELRSVEKEQQSLKRDVNSMVQYEKNLTERLSKLNRQLEEFKKKYSNLEQVEQEQIKQRSSYQDQVTAQGLSDFEIQRLTTDRHQLDEQTKVATARLTEITKAANESEIELQRAFTKVENFVEDYQTKASKLGLLPTGPEGFESVDFNQELNGASSTPQGIVPDSTGIRSSIMQLKQSVTRNRHNTTHEIFNVESEVLTLSDHISALKDQINELELQHEKLDKVLDDSKQAFHKEMATSNGELDRIQAQVNELKTHMQGGVLTADQRLASLDNEFQEVSAKVKRLRHENEDALHRQLEYIISIKDELESRLESLLKSAKDL